MFVCISISNTIPIQSFHECNHLIHLDDELSLHENHEECSICDHIFKQKCDTPFNVNFSIYEAYSQYTLPFYTKLPQSIRFHASDRGPPTTNFS
ncbi:MAG: hypothetical protein Q8K70_10835 [Bacteroidota bacterium]|nr:hypothetical protein [Bacteroidota bacterium]